MFEKYIYNKAFLLESGKKIYGLELAYHTLGTLNKDKSNVIWVCHPLTGSSDVASWWDGLVGENNFFNPEEHFIICVNVIGSCYGSTGPLSFNPLTREKYFHDFPEITLRDVVNSFIILKKHLKIDKINTLIGGSLGGMQALEWSIIEPNCAENLVLISTNAVTSPWAIAFNESQRMAILMDETWNNHHEKAGLNGMKVARSIALLSYRNYDTYKVSQSEQDINKIDDYKASSYQRYQGEKLGARFNAFSYWILTKLFDAHNIARNRTNVTDVLNSIKIHTLVIGISSDYIFPVKEQKFLSENIPNSTYYEIESIFGHDGFLLEFEKIEQILKENLILN